MHLFNGEGITSQDSDDAIDEASEGILRESTKRAREFADEVNGWGPDRVKAEFPSSDPFNERILAVNNLKRFGGYKGAVQHLKDSADVALNKIAGKYFRPNTLAQYASKAFRSNQSIISTNVGIRFSLRNTTVELYDLNDGAEYGSFNYYSR